MLHLVLTILSGISISAILRYNEGRGGDRFVVAGANYVVAGLLGAILAPNGSASMVSPTEVAFGMVVGLGFVGGFVAIMNAMRQSGMAVPATASRLSTLVPVVGSVVLYGEAPSALQYAGIGVGVAAFVLLGFAQRRNRDGHRIDARGLWLLVAVFAISGAVDLAMKIAQESGSARGPFMLLVFGTAFLVCLGVVLFGRRKVRVADLLVGVALGVPNFAASFFLLRALGELDGVVVFPTMNASIVLGVTVLAIVLWRELPTPATATGLALAAAAVVLLGLG